MTQSWNVRVAGVEREVTAVVDEANGRTAIRVDGRIAGRPMAADENERELVIEGEAYVVRRQPSGGFSLDRSRRPVTMNTPMPARSGARTSPGMMPVAKAKTAKKASLPIGRIIGSVILLVLIGGAVKVGGEAWGYLNVPWKSYTSPDRQFQVNMAGEPERSGTSYAAGGSSLPAVKLLSRYRNHAYAVEYIQFPSVVPDERTFPLLQEIMGEILKHHKAKLEFGDRTYVGGVNAIAFRATFPDGGDWPLGTIRGHLFFHKNRLYAVYGYVPKGELFAFDVSSYLTSLRLSD